MKRRRNKTLGDIESPTAKPVQLPDDVNVAKIPYNDDLEDSDFKHLRRVVEKRKE